MAFPTTSVITSFTGADEDPLSESSAWSGPIQNGVRTLRRVSNAAARSNTGAAAEGQSYRSAGTFGPNLESYVTMSTLPNAGGGMSVWGRIHNPGNASTMEAYLAVYTDGTGFRLYKVTSGGTFAQLGSTDSTAASAGDKLGLECIGTTIRCLHYTGGSWVQRVSATDSAITTAGYIGLESSSDVGRADDFGGGTAAGAVTGASSLTITAGIATAASTRLGSSAQVSEIFGVATAAKRERFAAVSAATTMTSSVAGNSARGANVSMSFTFGMSVDVSLLLTPVDCATLTLTSATTDSVTLQGA